jgi:hypothetical protein
MGYGDPITNADAYRGSYTADGFIASDTTHLKISDIAIEE